MSERSYDPYLFSFEKLNQAIASGESVVFCRGINPVQIISLAPDISLSGSLINTIPSSQIETQNKIGEGSFLFIFYIYFIFYFI